MKQKMKHLQSLVAVALCVIFAMSFASCSKDDDEPEKPKVEKRMMSIDELSFVYTDGKITQTLCYESIEDNIIYTESSIKIGNQTYYLNNGLVTKYVESDKEYQEFTYEDGRIKTWKKYYYDEVYENCIFEWKDGVIVRQTWYYDEDKTEEFCDYQYNYTPDPDYGGSIAAFQSGWMFYDVLPEALIVQGYFGKWPKYLVSGAIDVSEYSDIADTYTYILDSDGYPLAMIGSKDATFTWENIK